MIRKTRANFKASVIIIIFFAIIGLVGTMERNGDQLKERIEREQIESILSMEQRMELNN